MLRGKIEQNGKGVAFVLADVAKHIGVVEFERLKIAVLEHGREVAQMDKVAIER